jgi:hypothetical protein
MRRKELILPPDPRIASLELALRIKEPYKNEQEKKTPSIKTAVMSTENRSPQLVPGRVSRRVRSLQLCGSTALAY